MRVVRITYDPAFSIYKRDRLAGYKTSRNRKILWKRGLVLTGPSQVCKIWIKLEIDLSKDNYNSIDTCRLFNHRNCGNVVLLTYRIDDAIIRAIGLLLNNFH